MWKTLELKLFFTTPVPRRELPSGVLLDCHFDLLDHPPLFSRTHSVWFPIWKKRTWVALMSTTKMKHHRRESFLPLERNPLYIFFSLFRWKKCVELEENLYWSNNWSLFYYIKLFCVRLRTFQSTIVCIWLTHYKHYHAHKTINIYTAINTFDVDEKGTITDILSEKSSYIPWLKYFFGHEGIALTKCVTFSWLIRWPWQ